MTTTDRATTRFREFSNPATGELITFTEVDQEVVRFNWRSLPGGSITEHVHPHHEERFTIVAGEAHFTVNGEARVMGPGGNDRRSRRRPTFRVQPRFGGD